jgi:hypothetical protein
MRTYIHTYIHTGEDALNAIAALQALSQGTYDSEILHTDQPFPAHTPLANSSSSSSNNNNNNPPLHPHDHTYSLGPMAMHDSTNASQISGQSLTRDATRTQNQTMVERIPTDGHLARLGTNQAGLDSSQMFVTSSSSSSLHSSSSSTGSSTIHEGGQSCGQNSTSMQVSGMESEHEVQRMHSHSRISGHAQPRAGSHFGADAHQMSLSRLDMLPRTYVDGQNLTSMHDVEGDAAGYHDADIRMVHMHRDMHITAHTSLHAHRHVDFSKTDTDVDMRDADMSIHVHAQLGEDALHQSRLSAVTITTETYANRRAFGAGADRNSTSPPLQSMNIPPHDPKSGSGNAGMGMGMSMSMYPVMAAGSVGRLHPGAPQSQHRDSEQGTVRCHDTETARMHVHMGMYPDVSDHHEGAQAGQQGWVGHLQEQRGVHVTVAGHDSARGTYDNSRERPYDGHVSHRHSHVTSQGGKNLPGSLYPDMWNFARDFESWSSNSLPGESIASSMYKNMRHGQAGSSVQYMPAGMDMYTQPGASPGQPSYRPGIEASGPGSASDCGVPGKKAPAHGVSASEGGGRAYHGLAGDLPLFPPQVCLHVDAGFAVYM